ncbi:MAG: hypothetical protein J5590_03175 [Clostridia bacterium]|nr:hypothetical protein [Clostridia bacterium]
MNCPKCGRELLIGSNVCPVCDVNQEQNTEKTVKQGKRLTKAGKMIFGLLALLIVFIISLSVILSLRGNIIKGAGNGNYNYLNGGAAVQNGNKVYFVSGETLYASDKKLSEKQKLDSGKTIGNLVFESGCLYYTKDKTVYEYNPKTRRINPLNPLGEEAVTVSGFSNKSIFYNDNGYVTKLDLSKKTYDNRVKGMGVFDKGKLYFIEGSNLFCWNAKNNNKDTIATVETNVIPVFVKSGRIYCYDRKDLKLFSIGIKDGNRIEEINTSELENISEIEHVNIFKDFYILQGQDGIYRMDPNSKEIKKIFDIDFVGSPIIILEDGIFLSKSDGSVCIGDINGKIKYSIDS